jgi:outer membrane protein
MSFRRWAQVLVATALVGVTAPSGARAETLADALVSAYRNSNLLEQNRALLRASDEDVVQAQARLLPVIDFVTQFQATIAGAANLSLNLGVSLTLIDFGRGQLAVAASREQILALRASLIGVEQEVLLNTVTAYLNLNSTIETVTLRRNNVALIQEQLRAARARFELGDSTRTDVAIAEARLAAAQSALAAAEGDVAVARETFAFRVGRRPGRLSAPPALPRLPATLEAALAEARANHPAILQVQHRVSAADIAAQIARTERLGTVSGSLSVTSQTGRTGADASASIRYSVPLYTGGAIPSRERQAVAQAEAQRAALNQTVALVLQSVGSSWAQLSVARSRLEASALQIEAAQAAYDAVSAEAEFGTRTTLDVLNAEQELLDARSARIIAAASVQNAAYVLLESMGRLTVQSLNLGIPVYDVEAYGASLRRRETGSSATVPSVQGQRLDRVMGRYQRN